MDPRKNTVGIARACTASQRTVITGYFAARSKGFSALQLTQPDPLRTGVVQGRLGTPNTFQWLPHSHSASHSTPFNHLHPPVPRHPPPQNPTPENQKSKCQKCAKVSSEPNPKKVTPRARKFWTKSAKSVENTLRGEKVASFLTKSCEKSCFFLYAI